MREGTTHLLLQVVYPDGTAFQLPAGGPLELEIETRLAEKLALKTIALEDTLAKAVTEKGVGYLSSSEKVETAVRVSYRETVQIERLFREIFKEVMFEFKDRVANP